MSVLAIKGGKPVRTEPFPRYNTITDAEKKAVLEVLNTGKLSGFLANYSKEFYGGPKVREFEALWSKMFNARYTVSVNSATSGLIAAVGAAGLGPGDEIIVSPYTMSASAACTFVYGAVPVFADIQEDIFTLDPASIEERLTPHTKAILVVHIFGHPADMDPILGIARKHNLVVIEDCAQAPLTLYKGKHVGTLGDMGIYSLNIHKHIQTGEGGMITTNSDVYAERLQLIRNHGELSAKELQIKDLTNLWGFNFRLNEIEAAMGIVQLSRLEDLVKTRIGNAEYIADRLSRLPGIIPPAVYEGCRHVYYMQPFKYDENTIGVPRNAFIKAIATEIPPTRDFPPEEKFIYAGYVEPLYLQPIYQNRAATRCSYNCPRYHGKPNYQDGICPVAERMHRKELFNHEYMRPPMSKQDLDDFVRAFEKVYENRYDLL